MKTLPTLRHVVAAYLLVCWSDHTRHQIVSALFHDTRFPKTLQPRSPFIHTETAKNVLESLFQNERDDPSTQGSDPNVSLQGGSSITIDPNTILQPPQQSPEDTLNLVLEDTSILGNQSTSTPAQNDPQAQNDIDDLLRDLMRPQAACRLAIPLPKFINRGKLQVILKKMAF